MDRQVVEMLADINEANRDKAEDLWRDLLSYTPEAAGSTKSHHAWDYGYRDHVQEAMNLAYLFYGTLDDQRSLEFSLSSALLVLFLHDCEKPFRHASDEQLENFSWIKKRPTKSDKHFQTILLEHYNFVLSKEELNGLKYVEGEGTDYIEGERIQSPLAAFCHICDTVSARIWFDYPLKNE
jgi:hypothetical protein